MSCGTSANAMSLVTQTSRPIRGKGADVMFGLSALSAGSRLQDLTTTTSIKRCLPNLTMLPILTNTNALTITCLCYSARREMMDPQTLLDSTFFLIPSFVPKKGLDPQVSIWLPNGAKSHVSLWHVILSILSSHACNLSIFLQASSWGNLHNLAADNKFSSSFH